MLEIIMNEWGYRGTKIGCEFIIIGLNGTWKFQQIWRYMEVHCNSCIWKCPKFREKISEFPLLLHRQNLILYKKLQIIRKESHFAWPFIPSWPNAQAALYIENQYSLSTQQIYYCSLKTQSVWSIYIPNAWSLIPLCSNRTSLNP